MTKIKERQSTVYRMVKARLQGRWATSSPMELLRTGDWEDVWQGPCGEEVRDEDLPALNETGRRQGVEFRLTTTGLQVRGMI